MARYWIEPVTIIRTGENPQTHETHYSLRGFVIFDGATSRYLDSKDGNHTHRHMLAYPWLNQLVVQAELKRLNQAYERERQAGEALRDGTK